MKARDHARIPVSWNTSPHGGFTSGKPWMRVNDDFPTWNAASQVDDDNSVFTFWKRVLGTRKQYDVLVYGDFTLLFPEHEQLFAYTRCLKAGTVALVIMNFSKKELEFRGPLPQIQGAGGESLAWDGFEYVIGTTGRPESLFVGEGLTLKPYEGHMYISHPK
ncbi:hypothetical protein V5O48_005733 [Marasmius crinis-equi]|uniref:Glycosyl hydrolase family 13 catalytic domain-containing protein n=1 Tax=Marasmius crinis-equi TaxID=585013 RepID=A0ABR3FLI8_9AGAR